MHTAAQTISRLAASCEAWAAIDNERVVTASGLRKDRLELDLVEVRHSVEL
jgi:hypothetical protein